MVTAFLQLFNDTLSCSFFFYLFTNISPQEILRSLIFNLRSYIYQIVNQFRNVTFMFVNMFEHFEYATPSLWNNIDFINQRNSTTFCYVISKIISVLQLFLRL